MRQASCPHCKKLPPDLAADCPVCDGRRYVRAGHDPGPLTMDGWDYNTLLDKQQQDTLLKWLHGLVADDEPLVQTATIGEGTVTLVLIDLDHEGRPYRGSRGEVATVTRVIETREMPPAWKPVFQ